MSDKKNKIYVVGAGLAGSECAYQLAKKGYEVVLYEMRPTEMTPAHKTSLPAELVCSNSFGSQTDYSAPGQLKWEAEQKGSLILKTARDSAIPAGMALGVDRVVFAQKVLDELSKVENIKIEKKVVKSLDEVPRPAVIATGPLTHEPLAESLKDHFGNDFLFFYDAIAPIIDTETINMDVAWKANRWEEGAGDYINCPLNQEQYFNLIEEIAGAKKMELKEFEITPYFEACMPVEEIVERGPLTLKHGPLSPKGLTDPKSGLWAYAVVQLRQDNLEGTAYNMVGFQTKMTYPEQKRVFRLIPGLEEAEFLKLGSIHRNLYIHSPKKLSRVLSSLKDPGLFFAGQITGVEGYFESTCIGIMVADFVESYFKNEDYKKPPRASAFGSLLNAITEPKDNFQPTNINFGLFPNLPEGMEIRGRRAREQRRDKKLELAKEAFLSWK